MSQAKYHTLHFNINLLLFIYLLLFLFLLCGTEGEGQRGNDATVQEGVSYDLYLSNKTRLPCLCSLI